MRYKGFGLCAVVLITLLASQAIASGGSVTLTLGAGAKPHASSFDIKVTVTVVEWFLDKGKITKRTVASQEKTVTVAGDADGTNKATDIKTKLDASISPEFTTSRTVDELTITPKAGARNSTRACEVKILDPTCPSTKETGSDPVDLTLQGEVTILGTSQELGYVNVGVNGIIASVVTTGKSAATIATELKSQLASLGFDAALMPSGVRFAGIRPDVDTFHLAYCDMGLQVTGGLTYWSPWEVPSLTPYGLAGLSVLLAATALWVLRRRRAAV